MLPFKWFQCGKVGHFSSKCPFKGNNTNEKERKGKDKPSNFKNYFKRNSFYSKEDSNNYEEEEYKLDLIQDEILLMALEHHKFDQEDTKECEAIVDMEEEFISALEEISRFKKKNILRKEQLQAYKEKDNKFSEEKVIFKI